MDKREQAGRRRKRSPRYPRCTVEDLVDLTSASAAADLDQMAQVAARAVIEGLRLEDTRDNWLRIRQAILNGIGVYYAYSPDAGRSASNDEA